MELQYKEDGPSLGEKLKNTYDSLEELAKAKIDLSKARIEVAKPALLQSVILTGLGYAFFIVLLISACIAAVTFAQQSWNWGTVQSWSVASGILLVCLGITGFALKRALGMLLIAFDSKGATHGNEHLN